MAVLMLIGGLALLTAGAEVLVRGAGNLARAMGVPSLIIGLTVVAFGTSSPELAVSVKASLSGQTDIALGNVVGSNIFNVLFILGISATIAPLLASTQLVRRDVPVMIAASGLLWLLALDGSIGRVEGAGLLLGIVAYTALLIYLGKRNTRQPFEQGDSRVARKPTATGYGFSFLFVVVGLAMLVLGARVLVDGAIDLARMLGVSELMIGLTIVAAGTSMPEVATSVVASVRGERDIAIGNVVGSNVFNILAVLGTSALAAREGVTAAPTALQFDIPVMVAVAFACLPIFFTGWHISRWEGAIFLGYYGLYLAALMMAAVRHAQLTAFSHAVFWFMIPMTVAGVALSVVRWLRKR